MNPLIKAHTDALQAREQPYMVLLLAHEPEYCNSITLIKAVHEATGLDLKVSRALVHEAQETGTSLLAYAPLDRSAMMARRVREAGCPVEIVPMVGEPHEEGPGWDPLEAQP